MSDLPDYRPFTETLIGLWWPAPPTQPAAAVDFWSGHMEAKQREADGINNLITLLGQRNSGHTAEDMLTRLRLGRKRLLDVANQCRAKSEANKNVAKAIDDLRTRLTSIANSGNDDIDKILKKNEDPQIKVGEINGVIWNANSQARDAAATAITSVVDATQQMLDETGVDAKARDVLKENGADLDVPPPRQPLTPDQVARKQSYDGGQGSLGTNGSQRTGGDGANGGDGGKGAFDSNGSPVPGNGAGSGADGGRGGVGGADNTAGNPGSGVDNAGSGNVDGAGAGNAGAGNGGGGFSNAGVAGSSNVDGGANGPKAGSDFGSASGGSASGGSAAAGNGGGGGRAGGSGGGSAAAGNGGGGGQAGGSGGGSASAGNGGGGQQGGGGPNGGNIGGSPGGVPGFTGGGGGGASGGGGPGGGLGGTSPLTSSMPGLGGGGGGPSAGPQGLQGGGLSQAFASGTPGGPPGPGGPGGPPPPWAQGEAGSAGFGQSSASQVPPSPSVTPMAGGMLGNLAHLATPNSEAAAAASTAGGTTPTPATPVAPSMPAGPTSVPSAPISTGPTAPSGPLPGYGADLRPAGAAAPAVPAGPAAPAAPTAPAPPGGPTTPASGGTTVASSGDRPAPGKPTASTSGQSGAALAGGAAAAGTAGAGAGTAAKRMAEQDDVQRKVDAVARQAPNIAWAAGLRDDETTTVLVTDLAGGWIPPGVLLPPGVTLLPPAQRRHDLSVVDLLGAVIATATHQPNTYVAEAGPNDPLPGAGERARYGQRIDELGPTLTDAAGASSRLPRIVQTVAHVVARRSGVADNEIERFRNVVNDIATKVLSAYPHHLPRDVADWMLLAAIDALIDGSEELARYHLAWHQAVTPGKHAA